MPDHTFGDAAESDPRETGSAGGAHDDELGAVPNAASTIISPGDPRAPRISHGADDVERARELRSRRSTHLVDGLSVTSLPAGDGMRWVQSSSETIDAVHGDDAAADSSGLLGGGVNGWHAGFEKSVARIT